MTKNAPMDDWVVYVMMIAIFAAIMYGKYLMGRGDKQTTDEAIEEEHSFDNHTTEVEIK